MSERLPVVSTRMNFRALDLRLKGAQKGLGLLKCKSDALQHRVKEIEGQLEEEEKMMRMEFKAAFSLYETAGLCGTEMRLFMKMCESVEPTVESEESMACGVRMRSFRVIRKDLDPEVLWRHGYILKRMKEGFDRFLQTAARLGTIKSTIGELKQQLEVTNKRKNTLEHRQIPRLERTVEHIEGELDEMEREEFFRLKRVQEMNKGKD